MGYTPLPFKTNLTMSKGKISKNAKPKSSKTPLQTPLHNKSVISLILAEKEKLNRDKQSGGKVKPKLKAEAKLKTWDDEGDLEDVDLECHKLLNVPEKVQNQNYFSKVQNFRSWMSVSKLK